MRTIVLHRLSDEAPVNVPITANLGPNSECDHADVRFRDDNGDIIHYTVKETIPQINELIYNPIPNS